jgi:hypothetical protein
MKNRIADQREDLWSRNVVKGLTALISRINCDLTAMSDLSLLQYSS